MAIVLRHVNPGSTPGGNGTTDALTGADRAYASLDEWEAAEQTDLVASGDTHVLSIEGSGELGSVIISGWNTDGSGDCYILLRQANTVRHGGVWSTNKVRIGYTGGFGNLYLREDAIWLDGLQIDLTNVPSGYNGIYQNFTPVAILPFIKITNCFFNGLSISAPGYGAYLPTSGVTAFVVNNIGAMGSSGRTLFELRGVANAYVYNNSVFSLGGYDAIYMQNTTNILTNNIVWGSHSYVDSGTNNAYTTTDPSINGLDISAYIAGQIWTNPTNGDFSLVSDSPVIDQGADLSSDPYYPVTDDVAGTIRSNNDIGAFEQAIAEGISESISLSMDSGIVLMAVLNTAAEASSAPGVETGRVVSSPIEVRIEPGIEGNVSIAVPVNPIAKTEIVISFVGGIAESIALVVVPGLDTNHAIIAPVDLTSGHSINQGMTIIVPIAVTGNASVDIRYLSEFVLTEILSIFSTITLNVSTDSHINTFVAGRSPITVLIQEDSLI